MGRRGDHGNEILEVFEDPEPSEEPQAGGWDDQPSDEPEHEHRHREHERQAPTSPPHRAKAVFDDSEPR
jgi:hypothetical protein